MNEPTGQGKLELYLEKIQGSISLLPLSGQPKELYEPLGYLMGLGGKRLRPMLCLLGYELLSPEVDNAVMPSLALEVFHNFTLMHDDIMDKAPLRRGQLTVHEKWNDNVAILSGDVMLVKAYQVLLSVPENQLKRILERFNEIAAGVCEGQQLDMNFEALSTVTEAQYLEMIRLKTAVLIGFSVELGVRLAGGSELLAKQAYKYGEYLGLGFQIMDDWLDSFGSPKQVGKRPGGDICSNKKTWLWLKLQELGGPTVKAELAEMSKWPENRDEEKVYRVLGLYEDYKIGEKSLELMEGYFSTANSLLNSMQVRKEGWALLSSYSAALSKRKS